GQAGCGVLQRGQAAAGDDADRDHRGVLQLSRPASVTEVRITSDEVNGNSSYQRPSSSDWTVYSCTSPSRVYTRATCGLMGRLLSVVVVDRVVPPTPRPGTDWLEWAGCQGHHTRVG